ncbi:MAG TPA: prepilin peptidase [Acidimicrobiales bacterium]|nr:prepilin peptidase [Acidimicrobiales bacterium]
MAALARPASVVVLAGVLGLVVGSFLNVVVYRVPRGISLSSPPSSCPRCGEGVKWFDNVPIASWLALRGKCRHCNEPISARYLLVEAVTGVTFAVVALSLGEQWAVIGMCLLASTLIALGFIEMDEQAVPGRIAVIGSALGAVALLGAAIGSGHWSKLIASLIGGAAGALAGLLLGSNHRGSRVTDRGAIDRRSTDRRWASALVPAGLWVGWLGATASAAWAFACAAALITVQLIESRNGDSVDRATLGTANGDDKNFRDGKLRARTPRTLSVTGGWVLRACAIACAVALLTAVAAGTAGT